MNIILTPAQAKKARTNLELSQGNIAGILDMNRSYISQFENGKYLLSDEDLQKLKEHYESLGYDFDNTTAETKTGSPSSANNQDQFDPDCHVRIMDGLVIPDHLDPGFVEDLLFEYQENAQEINRLCTYNMKANSSHKPIIGKAFLGQETHDQLTREALVLMARNYNIVEELRGHKSCKPFSDFDEAETTGDFIGVSFDRLAA